MFTSRYPIIAAPMNQVSYWEFAVVVHNAGAFPSISGYCYNTTDSLIDAFEQYVKVTNSNQIIAALDDSQIINPKVIDMLKRLDISHIIRYRHEGQSEIRNSNYQKMAISILETLPCKKINIHEVTENNNQVYFLKGNDGAGRPGTAPTKDLFDQYRAKYPDISLVPVGGIGTSEQVKYYIENGAVAVAVGTLLAASKESVLSTGSKDAIVSASSNNIVQLDNFNKQRALLFKQIDKKDDSNHTRSLKAGISGGGASGHLFIGNSIDYITEIQSVNEIIKKLMY